MISEKLFNALNEQINYEFESAHIYLAMAAYCADQDLDGFANFFIVQAEEERFHAMKFYNFVNEMGGRVTLRALTGPINDFESLLDVFETALKHEKSVTKRIYNLMDIANEEKEYATGSVLRWFIDEQVEEEATMTGIIKKLQRLKDNSHGIFMLDSEMSQRTFTPPTE
ncbi:ferritin [Abyssisolibacter fermentans]|uniref:ferritin n=1 Tax=Abyssisolibacter fermentans TaxID=1766203 RepID=UPI00083003A6|nr:ferritin [Abyssisolibacter fermentans]